MVRSITAYTDIALAVGALAPFLAGWGGGGVRAPGAPLPPVPMPMIIELCVHLK